MKMRKLLATAVAASLAVTSLATVASAAEKEFPMGKTTGTVEFAGSAGVELGDKYYLTDEEFKNGDNTLGITSDDSITVKLATGLSWELTSVSLKVTGVKGTRGAASKTYTYKFINNNDGTYTLPVFADTSELDTFLPEQFLEFTKLEISVEGKKSTTDQSTFDNGSWNYGQWINKSDLTVVTPFTQAGNGDILDEITALLNDLHQPDNIWGFNATASGSSTKVNYPFMATTGTDDLGRLEIASLSVSDAHGSTGYWGNEGDGLNTGTNQSYNGEDTTDGTEKVGFTGLATQVADFFNKQTNGTITFTFTAPDAGSSGTAWENGGIPSTQTGIKTLIAGSSSNDFALFLNYRQTGSLQAPATLDTAAGAVTFDISDCLETLGGQTMGVIDNIFYGLSKGIAYDLDGDGTKGEAGEVGLYVEKVTLAYDEDGDVDADIEEEDDADVEIEEDDVEIEEDDDIEIEEDDAEEDDAGAEGDVVVEDEDDDANPGTGVALAVVPALVAAAAVVVSKKRS